MKQELKRAIFFTAGLFMATTIAGAAIAEERKLSLGTLSNSTDTAAHSIEYLANRIEELSDGDLQVEIFWSAQLGNPAQMNQALAIGALDMKVDVTDQLPAFEPRMGVLGMPLVFRDRGHFTRFLGSEVFDEMLATLDSKGIIFPQRADFKRP
ncbi:TRAP transporter substrate-binding protein DctP [Labrenzia sp. DG1229]|uniref:TRAP transporter substrate-binding protein n=1 Tax=Labrenzia sp. DG1229 TaxID=681847 RepID=UPI00048E6F9C|nr:TRAP transporter substrate-binding protein DctP [Labrenzia sp. DG1229]